MRGRPDGAGKDRREVENLSTCSDRLDWLPTCSVSLPPSEMCWKLGGGGVNTTEQSVERIKQASDLLVCDSGYFQKPPCSLRGNSLPDQKAV